MRVRPRRSTSIYECLANEEDWAIGAYLVGVDAFVLDWILNALPRESWGVLLGSALSLEHLLAHLQQYVTLLAPNGEEWFFRFYDPRVLPLYLETVSAEERRAFLQGV